MSDRDLLRRYVERDSAAAFGQLVEKHMSLVYGVCRRDVRDAQLAEDVTQVVFVLLARKASTLANRASVSGWLFKTARFVSRNAVRKEAVRRSAEQHLSLMVEIEASDHAAWRTLEPMLNDGLSNLKSTDRDAVVMRYLEGLSYREMSDALGVSEDLARIRTSRAIEKLRRHLTRRNVTIASAILAALLMENAAEAAPANCSSTILATTAALTTGKPTTIIASHTIARIKIAVDNIIGAAVRRQVATAVAVGLASGAAAATMVVLLPAPTFTVSRTATTAQVASTSVGDFAGGGFGGSPASAGSTTDTPQQQSRAVPHQASGSGTASYGGGFSGTMPTGPGNASMPTMTGGGGYHPAERIHSVSEVLQAEDGINPLATPRQQDRSVTQALHRVVVKDEPQGFDVNITASLQHPLSPPVSP